MAHTSITPAPFLICFIAIIGQALAIHPNNHEALMMKAKVLYGKGNYKKVVKCTKTVVELYKDDREARRLHAAALIRMGELEPAIEELSGIIGSRGGEDDAKAWEMRALLLGQMRRTHESIHDINRCLDLSQDACTEKWYLRRGAAKGSLQDWQESLVDIRRAMAQRDTALARRFAGRIYMCVRRWKDSMRELRAGLQLDPTDQLSHRAMDEARIKWQPMPMEYPESDDDKEGSNNQREDKKGEEEDQNPPASIEPPPVSEMEELSLAEKEQEGSSGSLVLKVQLGDASARRESLSPTRDCSVDSPVVQPLSPMPGDNVNAD